MCYVFLQVAIAKFDLSQGGEAEAMSTVPVYEDHINLWQNELTAWVPQQIFDAHVHLGPPEIMAPFSSHRTREALTTFRGFTYEESRSFYKKLYSGKQILGQIAFGFPLREVDIISANNYIAQTACRDRSVYPFILADPNNIDGTIDQWRYWADAGVRFVGVKPYFDLLGINRPNSVFHCRDIDFTPVSLLEFMEKEKLVLMLHTSSIGGGDPAVRGFVAMVAMTYPHIRILLAHMGRYTEPSQFQRLLQSPVLDLPNVFLEMSSASSWNVYAAILRRRELHDKLLFGSDVPFGLITGVEHFSDTHGPVFITRHDYAWSDPDLQRQFYARRQGLTYNTYHVISALKRAMDELNMGPDEQDDLKHRIFSRNVLDRVLSSMRSDA